MSSIRVTTMGPSALLGAAMLPVPALDARAYQARGFIRRVRTTFQPTPGAVYQERVPLAIGGHDSRSSDSPAYIAFDVYYQSTNGLPLPMTPPVSVTSDNQMPVPAVDPRGTVAPWTQGRSPSVRGAFPPPRVGGQPQVKQPKLLPRFPDITRRAGRSR